jgi:hypothetical protein
VINDPMNIDEVWPRVLKRDEALNTLRYLLPVPEMADDIWNQLLGPMYDLLRAQGKWRQGRCSCGAIHPAWRRPGQNEGPSVQHRMRCPSYVGPLRHGQADSGWTNGKPVGICTCGRSYPYWASMEEGTVAECPDILQEWRGPRPSRSEETHMGEPVEPEQDSAEVEETPEVEDQEGEAFNK